MSLFLVAILIGAAAFLATARYTPVVAATGILTGDDLLSAQLHVPAPAARSIERGQRVRFTVRDAPQRGRASVEGRIHSVSADSGTVERTDGDTVLVAATIDKPTSLGSDRPLRAGMIVEARIETRSRSLLHRLFEPISAATRR
jgi:hypothetical protein